MPPRANAVLEFAPLATTIPRGGRLGKVTLVDTGQVFTTDYRDLEPDVK
jgi:hypothetical protein